MKRKGSVVLAVTAASVLALGAMPGTSSADVSDTCDALIGSTVNNISLSPLANIKLATCKAAAAPTCGPGGTLDLGVARITYAVCKP